VASQATKTQLMIFCQTSITRRAAGAKRGPVMREQQQQQEEEKEKEDKEDKEEERVHFYTQEKQFCTPKKINAWLCELRDRP